MRSGKFHHQSRWNIKCPLCSSFREKNSFNIRQNVLLSKQQEIEICLEFLLTNYDINMASATVTSGVAVCSSPFFSVHFFF